MSMPKQASATPLYVGVDVAKARLEVGFSDCDMTFAQPGKPMTASSREHRTHQRKRPTAPTA